jgi:16S rRNA U516 pseudouridylate synthase RsuA-like enzyme
VQDEGTLLKFKAITPTSLPLQYKITLNEGKKRHIRRVIKALGYELLDLQRIKEGEYELGDLKEGKRIETLLGDSSFRTKARPASRSDESL